MAAKVYYFNSARDDEARENLHTHLSVLRSQEIIEVRDPARLGGAGPKVRARWIDESNVFLCLLTQRFLADVEDVFTPQGAQEQAGSLSLDLQRAIVRYHQGEALLLPIIVGSCAWEQTFFGTLQPLPRSKSPIREAGYPDRAWVEVAAGLGNIVSGLPELLQRQRRKATSKGPPAAPAQDARLTEGHALLVGVGGANLTATVRDVAALRGLLTDTERAAFPEDQVVQLTEGQATRACILAALDRLAERAGVDDTVIFYYSGHGWLHQVPGEVPRYFLVPHDYDEGRLDQTVIYDEELAQRLRAIRSRKLVVVFDCCHAGGLLTHAKAAPPPPNLLKELAAGSGRIVISSSRLDEQSWIRGGASNSVFTECLLEALSGKASTTDGYARVLCVLDYLFREVPLRASPYPQHPFVNSIQDLSDNFTLCYHGRQTQPAASQAQMPAQPQQSKQSDSPLPDADQVREALCQLLESQFEIIIFRLKVPRAQLGGTQAQKAMALIQYLETQHGEAEALRRLVEAIRREAPGLLR